MPALRLLLATLAVLCGAGVASAQAVEVPAEWSFAGIGQSQRTIRVVTTGAGCGGTLLPPVVTETERSVRVFTHADFVAPTGPCPAVLIFTTQYVSLQAPLAGRALLCAAPGRSGIPIRPPGADEPPRVVGLSPGDASTVLRASGFTPRFVRRRTSPGLRRVTGQRGTRLSLAGGA